MCAFEGDSVGVQCFVRVPFIYRREGQAFMLALMAICVYRTTSCRKRSLVTAPVLGSSVQRQSVIVRWSV